MRRFAAIACVVGLALVAAGCKSGHSGALVREGSGSGSTSAVATPQTVVSASTATSTPPAAAASSAAPLPSGGVTASVGGTATSLDPCQLIPAAEAAGLAGASFGPGIDDTSKPMKRCTYGARTLNVFTVEVAQAADPTAAQAEFDETVAQVDAAVQQSLPPGFNASFSNDSASGIGDRAATISGGATIAGHTFGISGIYVLKGGTFFAFQDFRQGNPPTPDAMRAEAMTVLGRI